MGTDGKPGRRAVFLDRDGVINRNVFNPLTGKFEAPLTVADFALIPGVREALRYLQQAGFFLFLVSNQPNYAKKKSTLADLAAIDAALQHELKTMQVEFSAIYYCLHHPEGSVPGYSGCCLCRKPSPYFLLRAAKEFGINLAESWMVGDRYTDVLCGKAAGARTIFIEESIKVGEDHAAEQTFPNLMTAAAHICEVAAEPLPKLQLESFGVIGNGNGETVANLLRC
jgi:D-glycero-D-manno-heptose 1,7-bisphosphate phosphatase